MDHARTQNFVGQLWDDDIVPRLVEYIRIPNKSPMFDADWAKHGYMEDATQLLANWATKQPVKGMSVEIVRLEGRTPLIFIEVPGTDGGGSDADTVLLYGHLDKQPEMTGWDPDLGPWLPVIKGDKLFGRGGADDGYALFGSLAAIQALQDQGKPHCRAVILIEACEESGSYDLPFYVDHLAARIGKPSLVVCLDSGCGNYEQLWCTTSLRGLAGGNLRVDVLDEGVHSGDASGIVPSSFRVLRQLLARIEDIETGRVTLDALHVAIPPERIAQAKKAAEVLGTAVYDKFPFVNGMQPALDDLAELVLNRTWRPALSVTGQEGWPSLSNAGNVLRPFTAVKLSMRQDRRPRAARRSGREAAVRRQGVVRTREEQHRLERPGHEPLAVPRHRPCVEARLRRAGHVHGRRRHDPVHGHARREVPRRAVHDHRRAGPAQQRARPERIPAHSHRQARHAGGGAGDRRALRGLAERPDARRRRRRRQRRVRRSRLLLSSSARRDVRHQDRRDGAAGGDVGLRVAEDHVWRKARSVR